MHVCACVCELLKLHVYMCMFVYICQPKACTCSFQSATSYCISVGPWWMVLLGGRERESEGGRVGEERREDRILLKRKKVKKGKGLIRGDERWKEGIGRSGLLGCVARTKAADSACSSCH